MTKYQRVIDDFVSNNRQADVIIGGKTIRVKFENMDDDHVTLRAASGNDRYDVHYSQVVILSA